MRIEAGIGSKNVATMGATKNRKPAIAKHAIDTATQFCKNVYAKPGALFSVNR